MFLKKYKKTFKKNVFSNLANLRPFMIFNHFSYWFHINKFLKSEKFEKKEKKIEEDE